MSRCRTSVLVLAACLIAAPADAQSRRGIWAGTSSSAQGTQPFTIVLDSAASGWKGAAAAATMPDSLRLVEVSVRADTLEFGIPVNNMTVYVSGLISGEKFSGKIWVGNNSVGTVELTHKPAAPDKPPVSYGRAGTFSARVPNPGCAMSRSIASISTGTNAERFS